MGRILININSVISASGQIGRAKTNIANVRSAVNSIRNQVDGQILGRRNLQSRFRNVVNQLQDLDTKLGHIKSTVEQAANRYHTADMRVMSLTEDLKNRLAAQNNTANGSLPHSTAGTSSATTVLNAITGQTNHFAGAAVISEEDTRSWLAKFLNNDLKVSGAVLSGELDGSTEILGIQTAGSIAGSLLYGEAGIKTTSSFKFKDEKGNWNFDEFGFTTEAKATGAVARGEAKGNFGYLHGEATGSFLTGAVSGESKFSLMDDGKFNPSLFFGAKAEASVLQGEAEAGLGTDQFGVFGKADGDFLHAEAEAKAGVGYIGKDDKGNARYGAAAEASAMASVAQGKAGGGVTLFGIDIGVNVKGYALAAGVEAGASITTDGATASFGGALGLGAGLDISVDWSDAEWIGEGVDAIGDFVGDATDFVADTASAAYDATTGFLADAGDALSDAGDFLFGWIG